MTAHSRRAFRPFLNRLDDRCLLSGLSPAQMCQAYGINSFHFVSQGKSIPANGSSETIAIVDAYHDRNLFGNVQTFDRNFNLPDPQITQYWYGASSNDGWAQEECLDVEWAHAIAPGAKIIVVEARSSSTADLNQAVDFARHQPGVVAVSMSYGSPEVRGDSQFDSLYTTPAGHTGITFLASTGDNGAWPGAQYQATSPNVVAVGGTSLSVDSRGNYLGETGWERQQGAELHRGRLQPVRSRAVVSVPSPEQRPPHRPRRVDGRRSEYRLLGLLHRPLHRAGGLAGRRRHQRRDTDVGRADRPCRPGPRPQRPRFPGRPVADPPGNLLGADGRRLPRHHQRLQRLLRRPGL